MNHHLLLILHLIAATIWVGGHLFLSVRILPRVLRSKNTIALLKFEKSFEPVGIPALALLVITGVWMSVQYGVSWELWFSFSSPIERVVSLKLILLLFTLVLGLSAQLRIIPKLKSSSEKLGEMAMHIIGVTIIGVAMLILGSFIRYGGI